MANEIINLRGAGKGAAGSTVMLGARRASLVPNEDTAVARGSGPVGATQGAWVKGLAPQLIVECEGLTEAVLAITGQLKGQVIALHYVGGAGNRKRTYKYATATAVGPSPFPPMEGDGQTPLVAITFDLHCGSGVTSWATMQVDASDAGAPPSEGDNVNPLLALTGATRGAAGSTAIPSAVSASLNAVLTKSVGARNSAGLPSAVWTKNANIKVQVITEDASVLDGAYGSATIDEIVVLSFMGGKANGTLTCKVARFIGCERLEFMEAEAGSSPARYGINFQLVPGATSFSVSSVADMLVLA